MNPAVAHYHELLADAALAADSHGMLDELLRRRELVFGGRPLCTVLRPRLATPGRHGALQGHVRVLMRVFTKAYDAAIADPAFRAQFMLHDWEERLVADEPGFHNPSPTSRLDTFIIEERDSVKLTEYNAETPAGAAYNDALADVFLDIPVMRMMARRFDVRPLYARHGILHVLLATYEEWSGRRERPRIAILDWPDVPTVAEFRLFQTYFASRGIDCVIADPRAADYRGGTLFIEDRPVDLIYKRVLIHELVERCGLESPVIRAVRDRAVCMANGFRSKILHKKASLAVLSDERNARLFDADERAAIAAYVPWTRAVAERRTEFGGRPVDLIPFALAQRARLVLKPNDDYGGKGIVLGWTVDQTEWESALRRALGEPYIIQERVAIPFESYPSMIDGAVRFIDRQLDTAPFISYMEFMDGYLTRLSTEALLNVTAGGGSQVPTFIVSER